MQHISHFHSPFYPKKKNARHNICRAFLYLNLFCNLVYAKIGFLHHLIVLKFLSIIVEDDLSRL